MTQDWQKGYNWLQGLELISLDFFRPVYPDLGMSIFREETLRGLVRDLLLYRIGPRSNSTLGSTDGMADFYWCQVRELVGIAELALGDRSGLALTHWIEYIQCQEVTNPWIPYKDSLLSWASNYRRTGIDAINFSQSAADVEARLRACGDTRRVSKVLERQKKGFLSDWDLAIFKKRGLLDIPDGSSFFPFIDAALLAVEMHGFQEFWVWLMSSLTPGDLSAVEAFVRQRDRRGEAPVGLSELPVYWQAPSE